MARSDKPIGDLEYEKFDEDDDGVITVKTVEQSPIAFAQYQEQNQILLKEILAELQKHTIYLKNFFQGDIL